MKFIIVLGTKDAQSRQERVMRAIEEYNKEPWKTEFWHDSETLISSAVTTTLVFSGMSPEAEDMRSYARSLVDPAFPDDYLVTENRSRDTRENLTECRDILKNYRRSMRGDYPDEVVIVSSAFHIPRVKLLAEQLIGDYKPQFAATSEPITEARKEREAMLMSSTQHQWCTDCQKNHPDLDIDTMCPDDGCNYCLTCKKVHSVGEECHCPSCQSIRNHLKNQGDLDLHFTGEEGCEDCQESLDCCMWCIRCEDAHKL